MTLAFACTAVLAAGLVRAEVRPFSVDMYVKCPDEMDRANVQRDSQTIPRRCGFSRKRTRFAEELRRTLDVVTRLLRKQEIID